MHFGLVLGWPKVGDLPEINQLHFFSNGKKESAFGGPEIWRTRVN